MKSSTEMQKRSIASFALWLVSIAVIGCRSEPERSAMARPTNGPGVATAGAVRSDAPGVTLHRLWAGDYRDFRFSSISPDGRYLSMIDWSTVDAAVRDLSTGELHRLTNTQREPGKPYEGAGGPMLFSPDGRRIAYPWQVVPDVQLRVLAFDVDDAGAPRPAEPAVIFHNPEFEPYVPFNWSPDGRHLISKVWMAGQESHTHSANHLALISTADGTYQALKSFDWREPLLGAFSPDGRYVAYDFLPEVDSPNRDLFVISVDGTYEARIVGGPAIDRLLDWHSDGSILFHSDRGGTPSVWRLPMSDGRAVGSPQLLKADMWGVEPLGSAQGRFFYGVAVKQPRVYAAAVDLEAGRLTSSPVAVADPTRVQIRGWDWSPDGNYLAFSATTPGAAGSIIDIRPPDGREGQSFRLDLEATELIRWEPDGESIVVFSVDSKARRGFYRIDLESGSVSSILPADELEKGIHDVHFDLSLDGEVLYFAVSPTEPSSYKLDLVSHDLRSGEESYLFTVQWPGLVAIAPDGSELAVVAPGSQWNGGWVGTIPATGGRLNELYEIPNDTHVSGLDWTADGRSVVFFTYGPGDRGSEDAVLWRVPARGGEAQPIQFIEHLVPGPLRLHPDGRRVAFRAGESRGEVWVMEGLGVPASVAASEEGDP